MARVSDGDRHAVVSGDRGTMAPSRGDPQSRIFLVLLRQRACAEIFGQAGSQGLQQAAMGTVLVAAPGLAICVVNVPAACDSESVARVAQFAAKGIVKTGFPVE